MTTVSVVIPSLNDAVLLRQCLAALALQTRPADEIIVVDNGSTDDTAEVAAAAGARVVTEPVRGVLRATSTGFDAATGDILGRLDADSVPDADWVERIVERFTADPTLTAVTGSGVFYGRGPFWRFIGRNLYLGGYLWVFRLVLARMPLFGSSFAVRRDAWAVLRERVHRDDPRAHDDLDLSLVLDADMGVDFDRRLDVGVSARPFDNWAGFARRAGWAFHIVAVNFREVSWPRRIVRAAAGRRRRRRRQRALGIPRRPS